MTDCLGPKSGTIAGILCKFRALMDTTVPVALNLGLSLYLLVCRQTVCRGAVFSNPHLLSSNFKKKGLSSLFHVLTLSIIFILHKGLLVIILMQPIQTISSHFYLSSSTTDKMYVFCSNGILWPYN